MIRCSAYHARPAAAQSGVAAVEFALVSVVFFSLLFGALEFGRLLFYWNTTAEATRLGARIAVVCDKDAPAITTKMIELFPVLAGSDIDIKYFPEGKPVSEIESVTLTINPKTIDTVIPFANIAPALPPFTTTLTRESMQSSFNGTDNPVCK